MDWDLHYRGVTCHNSAYIQYAILKQEEPTFNIPQLSISLDETLGCTKMLGAKLESKKELIKIDRKSDAIILLQLINLVPYKYELGCYPY
eukprot:15323743-Ditylum_brightwellii.AAC.1